MVETSPRILFILEEIDAAGLPQLGANGSPNLRGSDLRKLIDPRAFETLCVNEKGLRSLQNGALKRFDVIANLITEPTRSAPVLEVLGEVLGKSSARVINRPDAVQGTTREKVSRRLSRIENLIAPTTLVFKGGDAAAAKRFIRDEGLEPPLIVRRPGTHRGQSLEFCETLDAAIAALEGAKESVVTQFVDFRSVDGLYRKFRVFFIGKRQIVRHLLISESWNVHAKVRFEFMAARPELIAEERTLFERVDPFEPKVQAALDAVQSRMPVDFFGMDFGLTRDGRVLLFEANATMSFTPNLEVPQFEYLPRSIAPARRAFRELLGLPIRPEPQRPRT